MDASPEGRLVSLQIKKLIPGQTLSGMENVAVSVYLEPDVSVNEVNDCPGHRKKC